MSRFYRLVLVSLLVSLNTLLFSVAYNGTDLLRELVGEHTTGSNTQIQYRGVLKNSEQYSLLQQAIDQGYLKDKNLLIKLKSEFTNNSLKYWASIYAGIRLPISGDTTVSPETWKKSLELIRAGLSQTPQRTTQTLEEIQEELLRLLQSHNISDQKRIQQLIDALNDPYAESYRGQQAQDFDNRLQGELIGIGVSLEKNNNGDVVIGYVYDGPAQQAGLQAGDILIRIDSTTLTKNLNLTDIGVLINGEVGSRFSLSVLRKNKVYDYTLVRKKITIDPILIQQLAKDTIIMTISMFQTNSYESFLKKIPLLLSSPNLLIDVRNNLGGSLDDTRQMLNHFIPQGQPLYHIIETNGEKETTYSQGKKPMIQGDTSLYFLTNHDSASASEIFIGVLHDYFPHSKIIGTPTYGKGTVQTIWTNDQQETLKFTTGKWLLGKSNSSIDTIGLLPHYTIVDKVSTPQDEVIDYVLQKLINK